MLDALEPRFLELAGVDDAARRKARAMFDAVKVGFRQRLEAATFLDAGTRARAALKLEMVSGAIGGSPNVDDFADLDLTNGAPLEKRLRVIERSFDRQVARIGKPADTLYERSPCPYCRSVHRRDSGPRRRRGDD
jgi:predicted metalloendopeptidase